MFLQVYFICIHSFNLVTNYTFKCQKPKIMVFLLIALFLNISFINLQLHTLFSPESKKVRDQSGCPAEEHETRRPKPREQSFSLLQALRLPLTRSDSHSSPLLILRQTRAIRRPQYLHLMPHSPPSLHHILSCCQATQCRSTPEQILRFHALKLHYKTWGIIRVSNSLCCPQALSLPP